MRLLLTISLGLLVAASVWAAPLDCGPSAPGGQRSLKPAEVQRRLKAVRAELGRLGILIVDLPARLQARHATLDQALSSKDWCFVDAHAVDLEKGLAAIQADPSFVEKKIIRAQVWLRASAVPEKRLELAERGLASAAVQLANKRVDKANELVNRVLKDHLGLRDPWRVPADLPQPAGDAGTDKLLEGLDPKEISRACPALGKAIQASDDDLSAALGQLAAALDSRPIRILDLHDGETLLAELGRQRAAGAMLPAARIACALLARAQAAEVDLGTVMRRFQAVNRLRDARGGEAAIDDRFRELVRQASDAIAATRYAEAFGFLDELLVRLGQPVKPSSALLPSP